MIHRLGTVDGFIAFDLDDSPTNAGGTRLAPDVTEQEAALLARAMTYKFAVLGMTTGGAKGGVRAGPDERDEVMARYCDEVRPLVQSGRFLTGPDLGTSDADFAPLRPAGTQSGLMASTVDGIAFEDLLTGFGVVAAADAALGPLEGRTVAVEGFGKVGGGVAREVVRRGGRVVAVSTVHGCLSDAAGLDVDELWALRHEHGDRLVEHAGRDVRPVGALFEAEADVLVPGARTGAIDEARARTVAVKAVVPAANVPYTAGAVDVLRRRGVAAHADFICNSGAVIGYTSPPGSAAPDVLEAAGRRITDLIMAAAEHPGGPLAGAWAMAEEFLRTWRAPTAMPPGPPLAI